MSQNLINDACKAAVAAGYPKSYFSDLESTLRRWYNGSGMDWTVSRLKALQNYVLQSNSTDRDDNHLDWFSQDSKGLPTDKSIRRLLEKSDRYFFQISGVVINSLSREPNQKDKTKWYSTARLPMLDAQPRDDLLLKGNTSTLGRKAIKNLAEQTATNMRKYDQFLPSFISSTSIPGHLGHVMNIKMVHNHGKVKKDLDSTLEAWNASLASAPQLLSDYFISQSEVLIGTKYDIVSDNDVSLSEKYRSLGNYIHNRQEGNEFGSEGFFEDAYLFDSTGTGTGYTNQDSIIAQQIVGHIAMLAKPGGKVRTVANPNQVVQFALRPFGDALGSFVEKLPGVYFTDQSQGKAAVQEMMRQGRTVASVDMTAATDTIDNRRALQVLIPRDGMFVEGRDSKQDVAASKLLMRSIELFYDVSNAQWDIDPMEDGVSKVSFNRGAPLGTRPSFPLLTLTNWFSAASSAASYHSRHPQEDFPQFAIVGDDICMDSRILDGYHKYMNGHYGGETNPDKTVTSNNTAEFCGSIIHPYSLFPKKPKYLSNDRYHNAIVLNDMHGLHKWERNQVRAARNMSISGLDGDMNTIIGVPLSDRIVMRSAKALLGQSPQETVTYSYDTLFRRLKDHIEHNEFQVKSGMNSAATRMNYSIDTDDLGRTYPWLQPLLGDPLSDHSIQVTMATDASKYVHTEDKRVPIGKDYQKALVKSLRMAYDAYKHNDDTRLKVYHEVSTGISPTGNLYIDLDSKEAVFSFTVNGKPMNIDMTDSLQWEIANLTDAIRYHASARKRVAFYQEKEKQQLWNNQNKTSNVVQALNNSRPFVRRSNEVSSGSTTNQALTNSSNWSGPSRRSFERESTTENSVSSSPQRTKTAGSISSVTRRMQLSQQLLKQQEEKEKIRKQKVLNQLRTRYPSPKLALGAVQRAAKPGQPTGTLKPTKNQEPASSDVDLDL